MLKALADKVFKPERVATLLTELKQQAKDNGKVSIQDLTKQLEAVKFRLTNVYKSIETGIELDDIFRANLAKLKQQQADLTDRIANYDR